MLTVIVPGVDSFDEATEMFISSQEVTLELEHSLASLSKWESLWEKPFLGQSAKTDEETLSYIEQMCVTPNVPPDVFHRLPESVLRQINEYLNAKMTATWFYDDPNKAPSKEVLTAEVLYSWMVQFGIPIECDRWHLSRLLTLIRVRGEQSQPPKKMTQREILARNRRLNEQRKAQLRTSG